MSATIIRSACVAPAGIAMRSGGGDFIRIHTDLTELGRAHTCKALSREENRQILLLTTTI